MSEIQRFDWNEGDEFDGPYLSANTRGDWVKFADHLKELEALRAQLRSKDEQLAGMRAEITVAQLKRAGCQGLAAVSACPAINRILHERAALSGPSPAQD